MTTSTPLPLCLCVLILASACWWATRKQSCNMLFTLLKSVVIMVQATHKNKTECTSSTLSVQYLPESFARESSEITLILWEPIMARLCRVELNGRLREIFCFWFNEWLYLPLKSSSGRVRVRSLRESTIVGVANLFIRDSSYNSLSIKYHAWDSSGLFTANQARLLQERSDWIPPSRILTSIRRSSWSISKSSKSQTMIHKI